MNDRERAMIGLAPSALTVFAILERAANAGLACPTNGVMTGAIGAQSVSCIPRIMGRLEDRKLIEVERGAINRAVTITDTGKRTAGVIKHQHWSRRGIVKMPPQPRHDPIIIAPPKPRVERDPCFRCGTRSDFGCRHSQAVAA